MALLRKLKKLASLPQNFSTGRKEKFIIQYIKSRCPSIQEDEMGNLYIMNPWTPLICAHMDTVQSPIDCQQNEKFGWPRIWYSRVSKDISYTKTLEVDATVMMCKAQLGWDDKCGIAIAMEMYEKYWDAISILFTVWEETWWKWVRHFVEKEETRKMIEQCTYCLIADRRHWYDIIGYDNSYCSKEFQDALMEIIGPMTYNFSPCIWSFSDANTLKTYMNCVNLSCGYYNPHTANDFVDIDEFQNTYNAMCSIIDELEWEYPIYKYEPKPTTRTGYEPKPLTYKRKDKHDGEDDWEDTWFFWPQKDKKKDEDELDKLSIEYCKELISLNRKNWTLTTKQPIRLRLDKDQWIEYVALPAGVYNFCQWDDENLLQPEINLWKKTI